MASEAENCKVEATTKVTKNKIKVVQFETEKELNIKTEFKQNNLGSGKKEKSSEVKIKTDVKCKVPKSSCSPENQNLQNKNSTNVTKLEHEKLIDDGGKETKTKNVSSLCHLAENEDKDFSKNVSNATAKCSSTTIETLPTTSKLSPSAIKTPLRPSAGEGREDYQLNVKGKEKRIFLFPPQNFPNCESECISTARSVTEEGGDTYQNTSGVQATKKEGEACCKGEASPRTYSSSSSSSALDIPVQSRSSASINRVHCSSTGRTSFNLSSVVHDQEESSELPTKSLHSNATINHGESYLNKEENNSSARQQQISSNKSVCDCENWPPFRLTSSVDEVDVDRALTGGSSAELCVECGLPVASWASLQQEVLLSVVRDREVLDGSGRDSHPVLAATPPSTPPPPPPPHFEVGWSSDLYLSREDPLSVDSPPSCDETSLSSGSDLSTVICVDDILQEQILFLEKCDQVKTQDKNNSTTSQGR